MWYRIGFLVVGLIAAAPPSAASQVHCEEALRADGHARTAAECLRKAIDVSHRRPEAIAKLEAAARRFPASGWLTFYLADFRSQDQPAAAIALYDAAIEKFIRLADKVGEVDARIRRGRLFFATHRRDEAWGEAPKVLEVARATGDPLVIARAMLYEADLVQDTGERLARGVHLLKEAEALVFPNGPYALKRRVLGGLGKLAYDLGRYDHARAQYDVLFELARANGDDLLIVHAAYAALTARRKLMEELPEPERLPEFAAAARELVRLADATGRPRLQAMAHRTLGDLLWPEVANRPDALAHYRTALEHARQSADVSEMTNALWALGRVLVDTDTEESRRLVDEALRLAVSSGSATLAAYAWRQQMRLAWKTFPRDLAAAESLRALAAIETQRTLQGADVSRAAVLGAWTPDYLWLIGALLDVEAPTRSEVSLAFNVAERMRARLLLDSLRRPPQPSGAGPSSASLARQRVLGEISAVQSQLLDPGLPGPDRTAAHARLERLERQEESVRAELAAEQDLPRTDLGAIASLERVEGQLRPNEALLSFAVGVGRNFYGEFAGGAWLLASTTRGTRVIRLPDRQVLHAMLSISRGLAEEGGETSLRVSVKLHEVLLREALKFLPGSVDRVILVPDGPLHHVPFAGLRSAPGAAPLGSTHEILVTPSASVWMRLREQRRPAERATVLVLADPALPEALARDALAKERGWLPAFGSLGRLPYARAEGRAIISHMDAGSRLLAGADATEATVKAQALGSFAVVHFATHALVDDVHPDRSAVLLAADAGGEDGLLQAREISGLPLTGRVIVLSACRSATGAIVAGEGVLGLSRSFFEAGARTVLGTLWPIRDDHAAVFFDAFYASFRRGHTVGAAMRDARRSAIARGLPPSVWSSIVVIGDDTAVTAVAAGDVPAGRRRTHLALALLIVLVVIGGALVWRHRYSRAVAD